MEFRVNFQPASQINVNFTIPSGGGKSRIDQLIGRVINVADYGILPDTGQDISDSLHNLLQELNFYGATLLFQEGEYLIGDYIYLGPNINLVCPTGYAVFSPYEGSGGFGIDYDIKFYGIDFYNIEMYSILAPSNIVFENCTIEHNTDEYWFWTTNAQYINIHPVIFKNTAFLIETPSLIFFKGGPPTLIFDGCYIDVLGEDLETFDINVPHIVFQNCSVNVGAESTGFLFVKFLSSTTKFSLLNTIFDLGLSANLTFVNLPAGSTLLQYGTIVKLDDDASFNYFSGLGTFIDLENLGGGAM